ncbi:LbetaH domain-containing protein [Methylobacterium planeticum]|nr:hypothetical protein [Methylobacterium planeticum]
MAQELNPKSLYKMDASADPRRVGEILFPYEFCLSLDDRQIEIGRFSIGMLGVIRLIGQPPRGTILSIGALCEASKDSQIIVGGEHRNESLVNFTYASIGAFFTFFDDNVNNPALEPVGMPTTIGDNVVISSRATILDGSFVGAGSILAANAVVTSKCDAFSIYGGVPAKKIRNRFSPERLNIYQRLDLASVRAHCLPKVARLAAQLDQDSDAGELWSNIERMARRPKIFADASRDSDGKIAIKSITKYAIGDETLSDAIKVRLDEYFAQALQRSPIFQWSPDIFYALGIE